MNKIEILFISDYVCPYCYVAKEALRQAILETKLPVSITWQPFELTMEPKPRVDTYNDPVRREHYKVLIAPCEKLGLDMKLPPAVIPRPYTRLAFEGWYFAQENGKGNAYNEAMYRSYFTEEKDIGDISVLTEIAAALGLDSVRFRESLEYGIYSDYEHAQVMYARTEYQPKGVPTVYMNGEKVSIEEYTKEEMIRLLQTAAGAKEKAASEESSGNSDFHGCGPDGC